MEFNAKKIDGANATVSATIGKEILEKNLTKMAQQAAKTMDIQGFRKGKVPVSVVKKRYADKLAQDAEAETFRALLGEAMGQLKIANQDIIGEPSITKYDKNDDGSIDIEIQIASKPAVELGDYKALLPEVTAKEATEEEIDARINDLAKSQSPLEKIKRKRMVRDGDFVIIDFEGFVDGVAFDGGKAEKFSLEIGSNQFIKGFEEQIIGMKYEEQKDIEVTFPGNYQAENLAGKPATFKVTLHEIQQKGETLIDDVFAAKIIPNEENITVEVLKEKIKDQIKQEQMHKYYNDELKPAYLNTLVQSISMDVPQTIVEQEINNSLNQQLRPLSEDELNKLRDDKDAIEKMREDARPSAIESVKATFIVDALAKAEGVEVTDQEVTQVLYYEAMQTGQDPQATIKQYEENGYLPAIKMSMIENKVITKLLDSKLV